MRNRCSSRSKLQLFFLLKLVSTTDEMICSEVTAVVDVVLPGWRINLRPQSWKNYRKLLSYCFIVPGFFRKSVYVEGIQDFDKGCTSLLVKCVTSIFTLEVFLSEPVLSQLVDSPPEGFIFTLRSLELKETIKIIKSLLILITIHCFVKCKSFKT